MRAHKGRRLRYHNLILRKGLMPPDVETVSHVIRIRIKLPVVQAIAAREELIALWTRLFVQIHFILFGSGAG